MTLPLENSLTFETQDIAAELPVVHPSIFAPARKAADSVRVNNKALINTLKTITHLLNGIKEINPENISADENTQINAIKIELAALKNKPMHALSARDFENLARLVKDNNTGFLIDSDRSRLLAALTGINTALVFIRRELQAAGIDLHTEKSSAPQPRL